jgi:predicted amidohydrolase
MGYREDESIQPGAVLPMPYAGLGCAICHDVRFPSMFVAQSLLGAHTIIVSASWGDGLRKADQWRTLTQARALDSCSFVVAVDQPLPSADGFPGVSGEPNGVGQSSVWAPDGELIAQLGAHQEAKVIDVPTDLIDSYRNDLRVLSNRVAGVDC